MVSSMLAIIFLTIISITSADHAQYKRALDISQTLEPRVLKAAALSGDLSRRGLHDAFAKDVSLRYVEVNSTAHILENVSDIYSRRQITNLSQWLPMSL